MKIKSLQIKIEITKDLPKRLKRKWHAETSWIQAFILPHLGNKKSNKAMQYFLLKCSTWTFSIPKMSALATSITKWQNLWYFFLISYIFIWKQRHGKTHILVWSEKSAWRASIPLDAALRVSCTHFISALKTIFNRFADMILMWCKFILVCQYEPQFSIKSSPNLIET